MIGKIAVDTGLASGPIVVMYVVLSLLLLACLSVPTCALLLPNCVLLLLVLYHRLFFASFSATLTRYPQGVSHVHVSYSHSLTAGCTPTTLQKVWPMISVRRTINTVQKRGKLHP